MQVINPESVDVNIVYILNYVALAAFIITTIVVIIISWMFVNMLVFYIKSKQKKVQGK